MSLFSELEALGELLADNLESQGVSADASDGLTTLVNKVLSIQTGGSCCKIEFSEASYEASGGSATLELYLQENYAPKTGATVTVAGSDSSSYTATTNSNGIATVTVNNISTDTTFTATYQNVSDTCTVTVPSPILFYDSCSSDNTSQYTLFSVWGGNDNTPSTLTFDTDHYVFSNSNSNFQVACLPVNTGLNNYKLTAKIRLLTNSSNKGGGVGVATQKDKGIALYQPNGTQRHLLLNNYRGAVDSQVAVSNLSTSDYNNFELTKNGNTLVWVIKDANGTQRWTKTITISDTTYYPNCKPCFSVGQNDSVYIKEIQLETIS